MDLEKRPKHLPKVQALAAIGQCRLMSLWDQLFGHLHHPIAQILLTRNDIADRTQYQNAQNTFLELLNMGVIPIVNENDTLAVTEIKFGDNDTLSAITAGMVQADYLFLMTDVDCLYDKNPRTNPDAKPIEVVEDIAELEADVSSAGSSLGTGGMSTKIVAARLATSAGVTTVITRSNKPGNIVAIIKHAETQKLARSSSQNSVANLQDDHTTSIPLSQVSHHASMIAPDGEFAVPHPPNDNHSRPSSPTPSLLHTPTPLHTRFLPIPHPIRDRYFWILHGLAPHGTVYIDHGAWQALSDKAGLLPVGIVDVDGHFAQQEAVRIVVVKRLSPTSPKPFASPTPKREISHVPHHAYNAHPVAPSHSHSTSSSQILNPSNSPPAFELHNPAPVEIGRAVINYSASEIRRIMGLHSTQIHDALGYADSEYVALRENIAFFGIDQSRPGTPILKHRRKSLEGGVGAEAGSH